MAELQQKSRFPWIWCFLLVGLIVVMILSFGIKQENKEIDWANFTTQAEAGNVEQIYATGGNIVGRYTETAVDAEGNKLSKLTPEERKQDILKKFDFVCTYVSSEYLMNFIDPRVPWATNSVT